jgi:uncharacterized protein YdeI (YjbR/CyaY-like superfamily)
MNLEEVHMQNKQEQINHFYGQESPWKASYHVLRSIVLSLGLGETMKWGVPCYTYQDKNVVLIHGFKNYCALLFIKGALMRDPNDILIQQTEYVQAARQIRFKTLDEILAQKMIVSAYINEAIEIEKAGLIVPLKPTSELQYPGELKEKFSANPKLMDAFEALTPGRKKRMFTSSLVPSNLPHGLPELKNMKRKFSKEKEWMIKTTSNNFEIETVANIIDH